MPTVTATLKMFDAMTKPLQNITSSMNLMVRAMEDMQRVADRNVRVDQTLTAAKRQLAVAEAEIRKSIDQATQAQQRFDREVQETRQSVNGVAESIKRWVVSLGSAYLSARGIRAAMEAADAFISRRARLELIVDEGQSVEELQNLTYAASMRSRADINAMTDVIARMGLLARDAFKDSRELVAFSEIMQKAFKVSGAGIQEQEAAMYQLSQAMAAGVLQGDEFRSIMENAPMLADAIAKFVGVSKGELKELSSEGKITSDVIKAALFAAADDINAKFEHMPKTFGDVFQGFRNEAFRAFEPVFRRMNEWLNSVQGAAMIQAITNAIYFASRAADAFLAALIWISDVIYRNWGIIEPILIAIGSALAFWALRQIPLLITRLWLMIPPILAQAAAWALVNWPILLVGAAIGLLVYALYKWGDAVSEVIGFVVGSFSVLFAYLYNSFMYTAEFFVNVWRDPIYTVKKMFYDLAIYVMGLLEKLARGIEGLVNTIPGIEISISGGIGRLLSKLENARANLTTDAELVSFGRIDYGEAFRRGQDLGRSIGQFASREIGFAFDKIGGIFDPNRANKLVADLGNIGDLGKGIGKIGKVDEVGKVKDKVDISSEDLKLMRELAEMRQIQNFVTLNPTVNVKTGDIREEANVDGLIVKITDALQRDIASSARAVWDV